MTLGNEVDLLIGRLEQAEQRLDHHQQLIQALQDGAIPQEPEPEYRVLFDSNRDGLSAHIEGGGRIWTEDGWSKYRTYGGRAEHQGIGRAEVGELTIYEDEMFIPHWFAHTEDSWIITGQKHRGASHPPISRQIDTKTRTLKYVRYDGSRFPHLWAAPLDQFIGLPLQFREEAVWRNDQFGSFRVTLAGVELFDYQGPTMYYEGEGPYPKYGAYDGGRTDTEVWFRNIRVLSRIA